MSNRGLLVACVALVLWTSTASAQAQRGFFASVNIGSSETSFHPTSVAGLDDREQSFDVGIGYAFGPYFAVQGAWVARASPLIRPEHPHAPRPGTLLL